MPTTAKTTAKKSNKVLPVALGVLGAALALYLGFAAWLRVDGRFPFHTVLNGRDVSLRRALDVQQTVMDGFYPNMAFTIEGRDAQTYQVAPSSFDFSGAERAVDFLPRSTLAWPASLFGGTAYTTADGGAIGKLARRIESEFPAFRDTRAAQNAYLRYDAERGGFAVVPDAGGTEIDAAKFETALENHIRYGSGTFDLDAAGVYRAADITVYSPELVEAYDRLNRFLDATVVYSEGEVTKTFEARMLAPYLTVSRDTFAIRCDTASAAADGVFDAFAAELAEAFDSPGIARDFITHDGETVTVTEKTWRARLDRAATAAALAALTFDELAAADGPVSGEFVWEKAPLDRLRSYVEIDLANQTLYLYADGELMLETPIVSGNMAARHGTPAGAFSLIGKYRNVTLRGPDYASFVRYWMPFNNKIGMHDASWRSRFGGTIYRTNGSHGCVNMPRAAAEQLYETIDDTYAVVCYWREA